MGVGEDKRVVEMVHTPMHTTWTKNRPKYKRLSRYDIESIRARIRQKKGGSSIEWRERRGDWCGRKKKE